MYSHICCYLRLEVTLTLLRLWIKNGKWLMNSGEKGESWLFSPHHHCSSYWLELNSITWHHSHATYHSIFSFTCISIISHPFLNLLIFIHSTLCNFLHLAQSKFSLASSSNSPALLHQLQESYCTPPSCLAPNGNSIQPVDTLIMVLTAI